MINDDQILSLNSSSSISIDSTSSISLSSSKIDSSSTSLSDHIQTATSAKIASSTAVETTTVATSTTETSTSVVSSTNEIKNQDTTTSGYESKQDSPQDSQNSLCLERNLPISDKKSKRRSKSPSFGRKDDSPIFKSSKRRRRSSSSALYGSTETLSCHLSNRSINSSSKFSSRLTDTPSDCDIITTTVTGSYKEPTRQTGKTETGTVCCLLI